MTCPNVPFAASDIHEMHAINPTGERWRHVVRGHYVKSMSLAIGIHILAIIVIMLSATFSSSPSSHLSPAQTSPPVRAVLYFPPIKRETPTDTESATPSNETPTQNEEMLATDDVIQTTNEPVTRTDDLTQPKSHALADNEKAKDKAREQTSPSPLPRPSLNVRKVPEMHTSKQPITAASAVTDYFHSYNNEQLHNDAQHASNTFRKLKTSPVLIAPSYDRDTNFDEQRVVKKVNCTGTTNKVLTLLSGFAGGTLKCTDFGGADKFIEKRIKKAPETDRQQR